MITSPEEFRDLVYKLAETEDNPHRVAALALEQLSDPSEFEMVAKLTVGPWAVNLLRSQIPPVRTHKTAPRTYLDDQGNRRASARDIAAFDWWQRRISVKVWVNGVNKRLSACTPDDLDWLAEYRDQKALENALAAQRYRKLATTLRDGGIPTVADLDGDTGRDILEE